MAWLAPYRDPAFQEGRYSIQLLPLAFVLVALGLGALPWPRLTLTVFLVCALVPLGRAADRYAWGVQNINAMQVHLGHWVNAHLPPTSRIAVNDIGAIAYVSPAPRHRSDGAGDPRHHPVSPRGRAGGHPVRGRALPGLRHRVSRRGFRRLTARQESLQPIYRVRLERNEVAGGPEMVVYRVTRCPPVRPRRRMVR